MKISKLTSKFQATIPQEIRKILQLKAGDQILFQIQKDNTILIKRVTSADKAYLQALDQSLDEWDSSLDEESYADLQKL